MNVWSVLKVHFYGLNALSRRGAFTIAVVSMIHLIQAWLLLIYPDSGGGIAMASLVWVAHNLSYDSRMVVSVTMMVCADLAFLGLFLNTPLRVVRLALMVPQQTILVTVSGFIMWCTFNQIYADGVERAWPFILNDQVGWVGLMFIHTNAILNRSKQAG